MNPNDQVISRTERYYGALQTLQLTRLFENSSGDVRLVYITSNMTNSAKMATCGHDNETLVPRDMKLS